MEIGKLARRRVVTMNFIEPVARALAVMEEQGVRHLPVLRNLEPVGMITDHNLLNHIGWLDSRHKHIAMNDRVEKIMRSPLISVAPDDSIVHVAQLIVQKNVGAIPLREGKRLLGIATKSDLLHCFTSEDSPLAMGQAEQPVGEHMVREVLQVDPGDATADALHTMKIKRIQHLPVIQNGRLVGMLSDRDILRGSPKNPVFGSSKSLASLLKVNGLMTREIVALARSDTLRDAASLMLKHRISALPVCQRDTLLGILSETDLIKVIAGPMPADRTFQF